MVMLSTGVLLIKKYFGTAEEIKTQLDEQTTEQIESLLDEGDIVAVLLKRKSIPVGGNAIYGLGVLNINKDPTSFDVEVYLSNAFKKNKEEIAPNTLPTHPEDWLLYEESFSLNYREKKSLPIRVTVPKGVLRGTYIYNVEVFSNNQRYGITKMYVVVP